MEVPTACRKTPQALKNGSLLDGVSSASNVLFIRPLYNHAF